ncbi:MAG TPA: glycosyltransferase family 4 protein [Candidatus Saccharimonadales bacterium]|nr:glycosyltransferase family 4 protein [Candidatus Saccharimonadales bacterium]
MTTKRLKIALVSDAVLPFHKGGKEVRIFHLAQELIRLGQQVDIYTMKWWDGGDTYEHEGMTFHALCRFHPLYVGKRRSIAEGLLFGAACFKLIRYQFDVLETDHMPYFPLFAAKVVSLLKRKPLFATWHEVVGLRAWREYLGFKGGTIAAVIERLSVHMPDHIIAVSAHTQEQLRSVLHYKGPLSLVSNGIDAERIAAVAPAALSSDVIYVGRLIPHKNVDLLLRAVAELRESRPNIHCVVVGTGPQQHKLEALVRELGLERHVTMTGRLESSDDLFALMKSSKVFVSPSIREGFGITVLEAYAAGLKVVTVRHQDNAAQHLVQKETGLVCEPTAAAIAEAIQTLLGEADAGKVLALDASVFDWSAQAVALKEVYGL